MWTEADLRRWTDEVPGWMDAARERDELAQVKDETIAWLSSLPWTHLYHQTFRSEISDGQSALNVASRFLAEYAYASRTMAALLVAERHPNRKSITRRANSLHMAGARRTRQGRTGSRRSPMIASAEPDGQQGRLYHIHGLLAAPSRVFSTSSVPVMSMERILKQHCRRSGASFVPYWQEMKEAAWRSVGAARLWQITVTKEQAATVYAMKYILKSMRTHQPTPARWEATAPKDDWNLYTFAA